MRERQQEYIARSHPVTKEAVAAWPMLPPTVEQPHRHARARALTSLGSRAE